LEEQWRTEGLPHTLLQFLAINLFGSPSRSSAALFLYKNNSLTCRTSNETSLVLTVSCVVQTSIETQGFRSLAEGEPVEFFVELGNDGKSKAVSVTGPNGAPPQAG
jgi:'Cold-shock' DNA-binding domain